MTTNDARATTLVSALRAGIDSDRKVLEEVFTEDVRAWTPALATGSLPELIEELDQRGDVFSDIELNVEPLDVGGDYACVEWSVELTHTGPLSLDDDTSIEPTGVRITLHGITVAEFRGDRICALRQYWDESAVLDQLGVARPG